ncbi:MAG TPA: S-isoprenylcysteine methyltransferase, partial [Verrucomicrobiae bacterium]|nr:S-isoprenylcysteine methyltransferase [Verrucomicrobiae bacterium]
YLAIVAAEENFLREKFGAEFEAYCSRAGRFIPNFSGFGKTWRDMEFKWRRVIVKEYGSAYAWLAAACTLLLKNHWMQAHTISDPLGWTLCGALALVTVAYVEARYLKKSRTLIGD